MSKLSYFHANSIYCTKFHLLPERCGSVEHLRISFWSSWIGPPGRAQRSGWRAANLWPKNGCNSGCRKNCWMKWRLRATFLFPKKKDIVTLIKLLVVILHVSHQTPCPAAGHAVVKIEKTCWHDIESFIPPWGMRKSQREHLKEFFISGLGVLPQSSWSFVPILSWRVLSNASPPHSLECKFTQWRYWTPSRCSFHFRWMSYSWSWIMFSVSSHGNNPSLVHDSMTACLTC